MKSQLAMMCAVIIFTANAVYAVRAQQAAVILDRDGSTIALEPYALANNSTSKPSAFVAPNETA
jgi:hypothetical protein